MKNKFYIAILIASFAVCGTVVFRPRVADRVLGLVGLHDETSSPYVAPELDGLATAPPMGNTGNEAFPFHDNAADGFAVAGQRQTAPSPFGEPPVTEPLAPFGDAAPHTPDFSGYATTVQNTSPRPAANEIEMRFGGQNDQRTIADNNPTGSSGSQNGSPGSLAIQFASPQSMPTTATAPTAPVIPVSGTSDFSPSHQSSQQPNHVTDNNPIGFANYAAPMQSANNPVVASPEIAGPPAVQQASGMSFSGNAPVSGASFVMPDPQSGNGFGDYRATVREDDGFATAGNSGSVPIAQATLPDRMVPPANVPAQNLPAVIAQPVMIPGQPTPENAVIPVQGMAMPPATAAQPAMQQQVPQFQAPAFVTPQFATPMQETPLYIPPQGGTTQPYVQGTPQNTMPGMTPNPAQTPTNVPGTAMSQPMPVPPTNSGIVPQTTPQTPSEGQSQGQQPVAIASATRHSLPINDPRAQYEPEIITQIETVFATEMLARVGAKNVIMTCDVLAEVRETLDNYWTLEYKNAVEKMGQAPTSQDERNFKADGMQTLFEQTLDSWVELQMLYLDMTLSVPAEAVEETRKAQAKDFDLTILPKMMEQYGVTNRYELNEELQKYGTTLERHKENSLLKQLAGAWFFQIAKPQKSMLTYDDMMSYYERHKEEKYKHLGQVKWEELAVFFSQTANEQEAYAKIAELGNRVMKGESFAEVAKQGSHGLSAYRGGERDTTVGSLKTKTLEQAVFALPVGQMSTIIREDTGGGNAGYYIVRVLERKDTYYTPFDKVQGEIQKTIDGERMKKEEQRVLAELHKKYPVIKTPNLRQIIVMASEAERNMSLDDSPQRHAKRMAKAGRLEAGKKGGNERPKQAVADGRNAAPGATQANTGQPGAATTAASPSVQEVTRVATATNRGETQGGPTTPTWEPDFSSTATKDEPAKKKSFLQSLNPFK